MEISSIKKISSINTILTIIQIASFIFFYGIITYNIIFLQKKIRYIEEKITIKNYEILNIKNYDSMQKLWEKKYNYYIKGEKK